VSIAVDPSAQSSARQGSLSAVPGSNPGASSATVIVQAPVLNPASSIPRCAQVVLGREAEQLGANITQNTLGLIAEKCSWEASATESWVTITSGASGISGGNIQYQVQANPDPVERKAAIIVANKRLDIVQASATTLLPPTSDTGGGDGGGDGGGAGGSGGDGGGD